MNSVHDLSQPPHDFNFLDGAGAGSSSVGTSLDAPFAGSLLYCSRQASNHILSIWGIRFPGTIYGDSISKVFVYLILHGLCFNSYDTYLEERLQANTL
jgi:hypothetical protein